MALQEDVESRQAAIIEKYQNYMHKTQCGQIAAALLTVADIIQWGFHKLDKPQMIVTHQMDPAPYKQTKGI